MTAVLNPFSPAGEGIAEAPPGPAAIRAEMMQVTPEPAKEWMLRHRKVVEENRELHGKARDNRPVRWEDVSGYARDMAAGSWRANGESLKIAWNDTVVDGQHRLYACMQAEVPFRSLVVFGVDPEDQDTIDTGIKRKLSDQLAIANEANAIVLGSVARWVLRWERGVRTGTNRAGQFTPTQPEILAFIAANPHLRDAAAFASHARNCFKSVRASAYGTAWMLFGAIDETARDAFLERVLDGADLSSGNPVLAFRMRIWNAVENGERLGEAEQLALMITAWNAWREDRKLTRLQLPKGGLTPRNFPEPK